MRKSVLIIDKPENCIDCPLQADDKACGITETSFTSNKVFEANAEILSDCPLKDLPDKQVCNERDFEHYVNGYGKGWNDYRGHLTGEYNNYVPEPYKE